MELLLRYGWPGNIRELQNIVERSVILCTSDTLSIDAAWLPGQGQAATKTALPDALLGKEKALIEAALARSRGKVAGPNGAAARLGIPASTLESKIRQLGIQKRSFRQIRDELAGFPQPVFVIEPIAAALRWIRIQWQP